MFSDCAYFYLQQTNKLESDVRITDLVQVEGDDYSGAGMGMASALQSVWHPNMPGIRELISVTYHSTRGVFFFFLILHTDTFYRSATIS